MNTKFADKVFRVLLIFVFVLGMVSIPNTRAAALAGYLDPTFGSGGKANIDVGEFDESGAMIVQPDGKIVMGGTADYKFALARFNQDGSLDSSFGSNGIVTTSIIEYASIYSLALQTDGKIIAAGRVGHDGIFNGIDFAVVRYNPDGTQDSTFGNNGITTTDFGSFQYNPSGDIGYAVAVQTDGKIVVAGRSGANTANFALARYNVDGSLDLTFGTEGTIETGFPQGGYATSLALQPDGKIVLGGTVFDFDFGDNFGLVRYNSDGSLDITFGVGGKVITDFGGGEWGQSLAIQNDGKIILAGSGVNYNFILARYDSNGSLDDTFGTNGKTIVATGWVEAMAIQTDGKIVVAGHNSNGVDNDFTLIRIMPNGSLDTYFANNGIAMTDFGRYEQATDVAIQSDGRIIVAGYSQDANDYFWALARYESSGMAPIANAGGPYTMYVRNSVTLNASASFDPNGNILNYEWDLDNDGQYDDATGVTATISFNQIGDHTIGLRVTDSGGSSDTDTTTVTVLPWTLKGFYRPVDMNGVYNIVKGGSTVPLKFEIFAGSTELTDVTFIKSLTYAQTSCDATAITDEIETTATGNTSLRYGDGQFIYNWKTPKSPGKCYRLTMTTIDNSTLVAYFKLK